MRNWGTMKKLLAPAAISALLLTGCGGGDSAESAGPPSDPLEQMLISFNGSPSMGEIEESMNDAMNATDTPITADNYSRAGSVLVTFKNEYGIDEMDVLECMPSSVTDPRLPEVNFGTVAAVCATDIVEGRYKP